MGEGINGLRCKALHVPDDIHHLVFQFLNIDPKTRKSVIEANQSWEQTHKVSSGWFNDAFIDRVKDEIVTPKTSWDPLPADWSSSCTESSDSDTSITYEMSEEELAKAHLASLMFNDSLESADSENMFEGIFHVDSDDGFFSINSC